MPLAVPILGTHNPIRKRKAPPGARRDPGQRAGAKRNARHESLQGFIHATSHAPAQRSTTNLLLNHQARIESHQPELPSAPTATFYRRNCSAQPSPSTVRTNPRMTRHWKPPQVPSSPLSTLQQAADIPLHLPLLTPRQPSIDDPGVAHSLATPGCRPHTTPPSLRDPRRRAPPPTRMPANASLHRPHDNHQLRSAVPLCRPRTDTTTAPPDNSALLRKSQPLPPSRVYLYKGDRFRPRTAKALVGLRTSIG